METHEMTQVQPFGDEFGFWTFRDGDGDIVGLVRREDPEASPDIYDPRLGRFLEVDAVGRQRLVALATIGRMEPVSAPAARRIAALFLRTTAKAA